MTDKTTPTPRTDAACWYDDRRGEYIMLTDVSADLERELSAANAKLVEEQEINSRLCRALNEQNGPTHMGEPVLRNNYHDAYRGARDEMQVWKARALTAEQKLADIYASPILGYHYEYACCCRAGVYSDWRWTISRNAPSIPDRGIRNFSKLIIKPTEGEQP